MTLSPPTTALITLRGTDLPSILGIVQLRYHSFILNTLSTETCFSSFEPLVAVLNHATPRKGRHRDIHLVSYPMNSSNIWPINGEVHLLQCIAVDG